MNEIRRISLSKIIELFGEENALKMIESYSCPINSEIEEFVKNRALDFTKRKTTITHFIIDDDFNLLAIFSLTHKAIEIDGEKLSSSMKKKLSKYVLPEPDSDRFKASGFLIAQLGKNFSTESISGTEIMAVTLSVIKDVQQEIGGRIVYLECEDKQNLIDFYSKNGFVKFNERKSEKDGILYHQMIKIL